MKLGVNIDHVATLRQARLAKEPNLVRAAVLAELAGAEGITIHLREDRRHIQDADVRLMRQVITTRLNLEMATSAEIIDLALEVVPDMITLVPEKREELTTEGGLNILDEKIRENTKNAMGEGNIFSEGMGDLGGGIGAIKSIGGFF
jgi:pyridoxine 5-phosphate synthase